MLTPGPKPRNGWIPRPLTRPTLVLGIESSCDDTAAAVVRSGPPDGRILSNVVATQEMLHASFGGVVPEIAARAHVEKLDLTIETALYQAGVTLADLDAVAATAGPGLIGGVLAGLTTGKAIAAARGLPMIGVNHLAGHALTPRLTHDLSFPYLSLLVSGGHCQFLIVRGPTRFERLGGTIDDAPGEAFDKAARVLGLPQPGGPSIERAASEGDPTRFDMPRPLVGRPGCDLSFSGLKTAVVRAVDARVAEQGGLRQSDKADISAAFQAAVRDVLTDRSRRAIDRFVASAPDGSVFCVTGGVAANRAVRAALQRIAEDSGLRFVAPPAALCTDNAAMIAWAGLERLAIGDRSGFDLPARPRWPLDSDSAPILGAGRKGAKA